MIEISGHDHIADLRYNLGSDVEIDNKHGVYGEEYNDYSFHNMLIAPGVTSATAQNPGYTVFTLNHVDQVAEDMIMTFLPIEQTYNQLDIPEDVTKWNFRTVNFK